MHEEILKDCLRLVDTKGKEWTPETDPAPFDPEIEAQRGEQTFAFKDIARRVIEEVGHLGDNDLAMEKLNQFGMEHIKELTAQGNEKGALAFMAIVMESQQNYIQEKGKQGWRYMPSPDPETCMIYDHDTLEITRNVAPPNKDGTWDNDHIWIEFEGERVYSDIDYVWEEGVEVTKGWHISDAAAGRLSQLVKSLLDG